MVKKLFCSIIPIWYMLLFPVFAMAAQFTATVSRNPVNINESFTLSLTLQGASANGSPSLDNLRQFFSIHSQQQLYQTNMVNGQVTTSTTWKVNLIPHKQGDVVIPSLSLTTSAGVLSTEPVKIKVVMASPGSRSKTDGQDIQLKVDVSNAQPYKNEPILYTVQLISAEDLSDIKTEKLQIENAILEAYGEPRIYKKVVEGVLTSVVEFSYLITPTVAGSLIIPKLIVHGAIPISRRDNSSSWAYDDDFDPFSMMHGFVRFKPFALATDEVVLQVQPAVPGIVPWLPARSLQLTETLSEGQSLQVGEPITREITIVSTGLSSHLLPHFGEIQGKEGLFKVYADKPELKDEGREGTIIGSRKEQYTLIPQQPGLLTLPEMSLTWWDVINKEKKVATIPARALQILDSSTIAPQQKEPSSVQAAASIPSDEGMRAHDILLYVIIAALVILLTGTVIWGITLQKRAIPLKKREKGSQIEEKKKSSDKREKLSDLNPT